MPEKFVKSTEIQFSAINARPYVQEGFLSLVFGSLMPRNR